MATADKLVNYISKISRKTVKKNQELASIKNIGSFASIFDLSQLKMEKPVIVSSTDGVGTKIEIANQIKKFDSIGVDLVAMCVNDLIVLGAKPIFFLDYIAINTHSKTLDSANLPTEHKLRVGDETARGLGVGGDPSRGKQCHEENREEIKQLLQGSDLVFVASACFTNKLAAAFFVLT